jgi:hypothetical protein
MLRQLEEARDRMPAEGHAGPEIDQLSRDIDNISQLLNRIL